MKHLQRALVNQPENRITALDLVSMKDTIAQAGVI